MPFNPSNAELNHICHLLALLGTHHILHVSRIRVKCKVSPDSSVGIATRYVLDGPEIESG